jgi:hypothetical protein
MKVKELIEALQKLTDEQKELVIMSQCCTCRFDTIEIFQDCINLD